MGVWGVVGVVGMSVLVGTPFLQAPEEIKQKIIKKEIICFAFIISLI
jgi:hypothetical protein